MAKSTAPFSRFEWMIAWRYLRARRAEGGVSVMTWISLVGITLAVAALIITLAVRTGFREEFVDTILGANAHVTVYSQARIDAAGNLDRHDRGLRRLGRADRRGARRDPGRAAGEGPGHGQQRRRPTPGSRSSASARPTSRPSRGSPTRKPRWATSTDFARRHRHRLGRGARARGASRRQGQDHLAQRGQDRLRHHAAGERLRGHLHLHRRALGHRHAPGSTCPSTRRSASSTRKAWPTRSR